MKQLNIPIILGSTRPKSESKKVASFLLKEVTRLKHINTKLIRVEDFDVPYDEDKSIPRFHQLIKKADAFIIVFPEYNHSFPGKLKSLLDTEFDAYLHKPVLLATVSSGTFAGARAAEHITPYLVRLGMIVFNANLYFGNATEIFDHRQKPKDPRIYERTQETLNQLAYLTQVILTGKKLIKKYHT